MAGRKRLANWQAGREQRAPSRQAIDLILSRRQELVTEVARLREIDGTSKLVDNAQQLLTRWWAAAGWSGREDLLKTVDWLIQLEKRRDHVATPAI